MIIFSQIIGFVGCYLDGLGDIVLACIGFGTVMAIPSIIKEVVAYV